MERIFEARTDRSRANPWQLESAQIQANTEQLHKPFASTEHQGLRNFLFKQDGYGPHRAKSMKQYLDAENVRVLPWPDQSPDLNPIENI